MDNQLFPTPDTHNKFVEPMLTSAERVRRMSKSGDPSTSHMAAERAVRSMGKDMRKVLDIFISVAPRGLICEELEVLAQKKGVRAGNASKRVSGLAERGELVWKGEFRNTTSGSKAKVWYKT